MVRRFKIGWRYLAIAAIGMGPLAFALGCGDGDATGVSGDCTGTGPAEREVRVHIDNGHNLAGVKVTLTAGEQTCIIDELIVDDLSAGNEFDQVIMDLDVGTQVGIQVQSGAALAARSCTVDESAFEGVTSVNDRGQVFATVFVTPPSVQCGAGLGG